MSIVKAMVDFAFDLDTGEGVDSAISKLERWKDSIEEMLEIADALETAVLQKTQRTIDRAIAQIIRKDAVLIQCTYFRSSGKYYTSDKASFRSSLFPGCCYPQDFGRVLVNRRELPGLQSGTWTDGPILVEVNDVPGLLMPENKEF